MGHHNIIVENVQQLKVNNENNDKLLIYLKTLDLLLKKVERLEKIIIEQQSSIQSRDEAIFQLHNYIKEITNI